MHIDPKTIQPKLVFCIICIFEGFCYHVLYIDPALPDKPVCLQTNINLVRASQHLPAQKVS